MVIEIGAWSTPTEEIKNGVYDFPVHPCTQEQKSGLCFSSIFRAARCTKCVSHLFQFCAVAVQYSANNLWENLSLAVEFFSINYFASLLGSKHFCYYKNTIIVCIVPVFAVVEHGFNSRFGNLDLSLFLGAVGFPPVVVRSKLRWINWFYTKHISWRFRYKIFFLVLTCLS